MKKGIRPTAILLGAIILLILGGMFEIHRWHTFQDITHSDVGYFKWKFFIDNK